MSDRLGTARNPYIVSYPLAGTGTLGAVDFGGGSKEDDLFIPFFPNCEYAQVMQISGEVVEEIANDTVSGGIEIGDGSDIDRYGKLTLGADAADKSKLLANLGPSSAYPRAEKGAHSITGLTVTHTLADDASTNQGMAARMTVIISWWNEDRALDIV